MAGSYPDVPGRRMATDADGTVTLQEGLAGPLSAPGGPPAQPWTITPQANREFLNNENMNAIAMSRQNTGDKHILGLHIFPEPRDIDGHFLQVNDGADDSWIWTSPDTTNGLDGAWTQLAATADLKGGSSVPDAYRDNITTVGANNIRGVKFLAYETQTAQDARIRSLHLYGEISAGQTPDRILIMDNVSGLEFPTDLDFGDVPRGSSEDRALFFRNNSGALSANNIDYFAEALYLTANTWYTFTLPGGSTFASTRQIGALAAASDTAPFTLRRITAGTTTPFIYAARMRVSPSTWT